MRTRLLTLDYFSSLDQPAKESGVRRCISNSKEVLLRFFDFEEQARTLGLGTGRSVTRSQKINGRWCHFFLAHHHRPYSLIRHGLYTTASNIQQLNHQSFEKDRKSFAYDQLLIDDKDDPNDCVKCKQRYHALCIHFAEHSACSLL